MPNLLRVCFYFSFAVVRTRAAKPVFCWYVGSSHISNDDDDNDNNDDDNDNDDDNNDDHEDHNNFSTCKQVITAMTEQCCNNIVIMADQHS